LTLKCLINLFIDTIFIFKEKKENKNSSLAYIESL